MTAELRSLPAYSEYRKARARLALISHAPTPGYDAALSDAPKPSRWRTSVRRPPVAHAGSHHVHSSETKIPRGSDLERRPSPPPPGSSDGDWDVWHLEVADWELCYQRRTLDWFDRQAERCNTEARLNVLRDQILEVVQAWLRAPPPPAGTEPEPGSFLWRCAIADSNERVSDTARLNNISSRTVKRYRVKYRGVRRQFGSVDAA